MPLESLPRHMFPKLAKWRATSLSMWNSLRNRFVFVCTSLAKGWDDKMKCPRCKQQLPRKRGLSRLDSFLCLDRDYRAKIHSSNNEAKCEQVFLGNTLAPLSTCNDFPPSFVRNFLLTVVLDVVFA